MHNNCTGKVRNFGRLGAVAIFGFNCPKFVNRTIKNKVGFQLITINEECKRK